MTTVELAPAWLTRAPAGTATALYRFFDGNGYLLYVGIAKTPTVRWRQHESKKPWWGDVAKITLEWRDTRADASAAEKTAIREESPLYNVVRYAGSAKKPPVPGRGRGRPAIGGAVLVKIGKDRLLRLDAWADAHNVNRAEAIRQLIDRALAAEPVDSGTVAH